MISMKNTLGLSSIIGEAMQISYVVADLDQALQFWTETLGAGPFVVIERSADDRLVSYRGQKSRFQMQLAFCYVGAIQIEIIQAKSPSPTPWTDFIASGREGLHHLGFWPDDLNLAAKALGDRGFTRVCMIETLDGAISSSYFSGPPHFGTLVELAPNTPSRASYFAGIKTLGQRWNGERPVRRFGTREDYLASEDCQTSV
jgi:catechol 2,3-dioxygenase-like lactoylglutathione lyase family enzyme